MIERDGRLINQLREQILLFRAKNITAEQGEALAWLQATRKSFDIVFLDPPFGQGLIPGCCDLLIKQGCLHRGGMVYVESERPAPQPGGWSIKKQTTAGQVQCMLLTTESAD